jgi:hypothetical protein
MATADHRYVVLSPDSSVVVSYDRLEIARAVAQDYGDGAHVIDTVVMPYHPFAEIVEEGEPVYLEYGGWDTKVGSLGNLIEAIKKGYAPIVRAFAEAVPDLNQMDQKGGTPLMWAVARRKPVLVELLLSRGADPEFPDSDGTTPGALAEQKGLNTITDILRSALDSRDA